MAWVRHSLDDMAHPRCIPTGSVETSKGSAKRERAEFFQFGSGRVCGLVDKILYWSTEFREASFLEEAAIALDLEKASQPLPGRGQAYESTGQI